MFLQELVMGQAGFSKLSLSHPKYRITYENVVNPWSILNASFPSLISIVYYPIFQYYETFRQASGGTVFAWEK